MQQKLLKNYDLIITNDEKNSFYNQCEKLNNIINENRNSSKKLNYKKLRSNRKIILNKLDNINYMVNEIEKMDNLIITPDGKIVEPFINAVVSFTGSALKEFKRWINKAKEAFDTIIDAAHDLAKDLASTIEDAVKTAYNVTKNAMINGFNTVVDAGKMVVDKAKDTAILAYKATESTVKKAMDAVESTANMVLEKAYEGLSEAWKATTHSFNKFGSDITKFFGDLTKMGTTLIKSLEPKKTKRKHKKYIASKPNMENKLTLKDNEDYVNSDINQKTLFPDPNNELSKVGVNIEIKEYNTGKTQNNFEKEMDDLNELNVPGLKYNKELYKESVKYDGKIECEKNTGVCESF